ncbi:MAG: hypothetical protein M0D55_00285 [Elusimicrobiota bacterium]|nr:MAG: hypothetical protein M0D55_00285 [Elusimicrobiota bacterium]
MELLRLLKLFAIALAVVLPGRAFLGSPSTWPAPPWSRPCARAPCSSSTS